MTQHFSQGPHFRALWEYLDEEFPDLLEEFKPMPLDAVRIKLNNITGLDIPPDTAVEDACMLFLAKLKEMYGG